MVKAFIILFEILFENLLSNYFMYFINSYRYSIDFMVSYADGEILIKNHVSLQLCSLKTFSCYGSSYVHCNIITIFVIGAQRLHVKYILI